MAPAVFWCTVPRVVGISTIEQGAFVADRYRVVERLTRFAVADSTLTGVEYEYWLALDEVRGTEVWLQVAASGGTAASAAELAGVVSTLRRLNHPALPAVLDFGQIEVVEATEAAEAAEVAQAVEVSRVGYVVLEPVEAESLATVLLRGALTEAEVLAVLVAAADVLKVLHEVQLVHGHLSAYSFLLAERGVLLVDLAAAAALELASGSELTSAADVYALAWLACVALAGVETVEAQFGVGFDAGSSPESAAAPQLLTVELVERRRAWAEANLVATYGLREQLAVLLIAALGEAAGRPAIGELVAALRVREESGGAAAVAGAVVATEAVEVAEAAEIVETARVVETAQVVEAGQAAEQQSIEVESAEVGYAQTAEESETGAQLVGAGVGLAVGVAAQSGGGSQRGRGGRGGRGGSGGGRAAVGALASAPLTPTGSPSGRHGSPPRRPKSALYAAIVIVVLVIGGIAWALSSSPSPAPAAGPTAAPITAGRASAGQGGSVASPSASAAQSAGAAASSSASAAAPNASAGAGTGPAPVYSVTPLATAPAGPSQALQQIKQSVGQAEAAGQIPQQAQGPINQAVNTLQQEIGSNSSLQQGISRLLGALNGTGVPAGLRERINQLIPYLTIGSGS